MIDPQSARLYVIIARQARRAIIFRRGPSKMVRLLAWNLETDEIEPGQWFKGRIYERRADLTPDGSLLVYFAASFRKPLYSWTAISKPPYLTALALWPKGDCWGGGGLFDKHANLRLNHRVGETQLAEGFQHPRRLKVTPLGDHSGWGEDGPILQMRMERHGWANVQNHRFQTCHEHTLRISYPCDPPWTYEKLLDCAEPHGPRLCLRFHGFREQEGRWYVETAGVVGVDGETLHDFGFVDWIDIDHNADILYAKNGYLYRQPKSASTATIVADLNGMTFECMTAPDWATRWP
jgi:hypothetical protein